MFSLVAIVIVGCTIILISSSASFVADISAILHVVAVVAVVNAVGEAHGIGSSLFVFAFSLSLLYIPPLRQSTTVHCLSAPPPLRRRSLSLFLLSSPAAAAAALTLTPLSKAEDIPLFGLRNKLKKVEQVAEEIVKEGEEVVEKEIQVVEQGVEAAEKEIAGGIGFGIAGDLVQAGAVAGAEAVGVLVGVSVVNGILGPEGKNL